MCSLLDNRRYEGREDKAPKKLHQLSIEVLGLVHDIDKFNSIHQATISLYPRLAFILTTLFNLFLAIEQQTEVQQRQASIHDKLLSFRLPSNAS